MQIKITDVLKSFLACASFVRMLAMCLVFLIYMNNLFFFHVFFYLCCWNFVIVENMLWIEDIIESTQAPSFSINSRIDIASFVHPHKLIARNIFLAFPNAQNEGELEGGA